MPEITYAQLSRWEGQLHSAEKRLDKMKTKDSPDPNILSYELSAIKEEIKEIKQDMTKEVETQ